MTLISLTDCCRLLGIDGKTLRHWLAQAQLGVQAHPRDARIKGLSREQVRLLAHTHHRSLAGLPEEPPSTPAHGEPPPLPAALLALPERLRALEAQLSALQQQVTTLTCLLEQASAAPRTQRRAHSAPRPKSRTVASAARKPARQAAPVLPLVESGRDGHYVVICPKQGLLPFEPESPEWFAWLASLSSFRGCRANRAA